MNSKRTPGDFRDYLPLRVVRPMRLASPMRSLHRLMGVWLLMQIALFGAALPARAAGPAASAPAEAKGSDTASDGAEEIFSVVKEEARSVGEVEPLQRLMVLAGRMHPILTHFPLAWIVLAAGFEWAALLISWRHSRNSRLSGPDTREVPEQALRLGTASLILLMLVAGSSVAAAGSGYLLSLTKGSDAALTLHSRLAYVTVALGMSALAARLLSRKPGCRPWRLASALLLAAAAATVGYAGHVGGSLVYGEGYPFSNGENP